MRDVDAHSASNPDASSPHPHADDRPFIGFSVSPRTGDQLRAAARRGPVVVHVFSDGRRYAGELECVTGLIAGDDPREVWLTAHLYEPLADDNSAGVVGSPTAGGVGSSTVGPARRDFLANWARRCPFGIARSTCSC